MSAKTKSTESRSSSMGLTKEVLDKLSAPFDKKTIGIKIEALNKQKNRAMLVPYLQHTDVYSRIESVDPAWSSEVTAHQILGDETVARVRMTILGVTRENAGSGRDLKSAVSDGHKRAAMLFGIGRYLYDAHDSWVDYNPERDYNRVWTYDDYDRGLKAGQESLPVGPPEPSSGAAREAQAPRQKTFKDLENEVFDLQKRLNWSRDRLFGFAEEQLGKPPTKMVRSDLETLVELLKEEAGR